jgi:hypothetical protein
VAAEIVPAAAGEGDAAQVSFGSPTALLNWFRPVTVADLAYIRDRENTLTSSNVTNQP